MICVAASGLKRHHLAFVEEAGVVAPEAKSFPDQVELNAAVDPVHHQVAQLLLGCPPILNLLEQRRPLRKVNSSAIVRIHEAQIPQLRTLIEIRYSRRSDLQQGLGETVDHAEVRDLFFKFIKNIKKIAGFTIEKFGDRKSVV